MKLPFNYLKHIIAVAIFILSFCCELNAKDSKDLLFEKDFKLTHTLLKTEREKGNKLFYYRLHLENKHQVGNKEYRLVRLDCAEKVTGYGILRIDENGEIWLEAENENKLLKESTFGCGNFSDGESMSYVLINENKDILASTKIFPKPLEAKSKDGAAIRLELRGTYHYLLGISFKPHEPLVLSYLSALGVAQPVPIQTDDNGHFELGIGTPFLDQPYGRDMLLIKRQDNTELKIPFLWGITAERLEQKIRNEYR